MRVHPALPLLLLAAGCRGEAAGSRNDAKRPPIDAAVAAALADPIMSDPQLTDASGAYLARSAAVPEGAPVPLDVPGAPESTTLFDPRPEPTLGLVAGSAVGARAGCGALGYSATWAARLPSAAILPADAAVIEAAGEDRAGCALRVVRFASALPPAQLVARIAAGAVRQGLSADHRPDGSLEAVSGGRNTLVRLWVRAADGGSRADLVSFAAR